MFLVDEADVAAIRVLFNEQSELSAATGATSAIGCDNRRLEAAARGGLPDHPSASA
jgi:hypothetical protein